ncbi:leucine-rich repeat domain-containing protein [Chryseobacterium pennae]|uniref:leucine-rich repeat domain-containing protein n=1 Tax=Chryseobacterium pennae TaxID=2258962 RepID=UPI000F4ED19E|nr:leucine-rich repeat domain-containing protein [Chryseobacterium pennae]
MKHFNALEKLWIDVDSIELAQDILSIESLKDLYLNIFGLKQKIKRPIILDLQQLKNVEKLHLDSNDDIYFKGISHLKSLKMLELDNDGDLQELTTLPLLEKLVVKEEIINKFPKLEQVKILDLHVPENYEVSSLEKFPNLEKLELNLWSNQKIAINGLEKLKTIVFDYINFDDIVSFENLPSLEELDLTECGVSDFSKLKNLTSLKKLNLENNGIKSLEGIENLKNLEQLAFYLGDISNLRPLNKLPKLREVFIQDYHKEKENIISQLDKPEILIRNDDTFEISID